MCVQKAITDFREKLVKPLFADITRTLEVTCYKEGHENHGSNFLGNAVVLSGIETVAQFIDPHTKEQHGAFREKAKALYERLKELDKETHDHLAPKPAPSQGSELAKTFMKGYFAPVFQERKEFGVPLYEVIWAFRNPHMHAFYPYYQKTFNAKKVAGAVGWLYKNPAKGAGITIKEVEDGFDVWKHKLYETKVIGWFRFCPQLYWFGICPQVLFVFFKQAVEKFIAEVSNNAGVQKQFRENYKRLAECYGFEGALSSRRQ